MMFGDYEYPIEVTTFPSCKPLNADKAYATLPYNVYKDFKEKQVNKAWIIGVYYEKGEPDYFIRAWKNQMKQ